MCVCVKILYIYIYIYIYIYAFCISHNCNVQGKDMNPTILHLDMFKKVEWTRPFNLGVATGLGEENF